MESSLPKYKCHKEVRAAKIASIELAPPSPNTVGDRNAVVTVAEENIPSFVVSAEYLRKHKPQVGGYFVVYSDGYESFSPAQAFEEGYTRIA